MTKKKPLPCIVCGIQPKPAFTMKGGTHQPSGATMFSAGSGNYGSTVWDEMTRYLALEINVCDECLVKHKDRAAVVVTTPRASKVEYKPWEINVEEDE